MATRAALPLVHPLELRRPLAPLRALSRLPHGFLLHSALGGSRSRWSFFGADPFAVFRGGDHLEAVAAYRRMADSAPRLQGEAAMLAPFTGGAVGYWAYDYGRRLERIPSVARDDLGLPDFVLALYDVVGAYDHEAQQAFLFSTGLPLEGEAAMQRARERIDFFVRSLERTSAGAPDPTMRSRRATSTFTPDAYRRAVEQVQSHIARGDIFQANLSQRFRIEVPGAWEMAPNLYESFTRHTPAPFMAYLDAGDHAILSASPERFLELRWPHVETRPIKGTRPRGATPEDDRRLAEELSNSEKDRAENVMIVDVLRNDLGRVCETGSIHAPAVCELEVFPQVYHLTSTVNGKLSEGYDAFDLLHACFPGGSITGAPKIRAMEILESLEPVRRHIYTGAIGWLDWDGDADWNIAIRTACVTQDAILFGAGGGVTADSDPDAEYRETLDKAEGIRLSLSRVLGEITLQPDAAKV
jgi:para-aminobenzoate synthetase component 1